MQLLIVDPKQPRLKIATGEEETGILGTAKSLWNSAQQTLYSVRENTSQIAPTLDKVPERSMIIGTKIVDQADRVGSQLPDIISPIKKAFTSIFE